jgi:hypothetical protein
MAALGVLNTWLIWVSQAQTFIQGLSCVNGEAQQRSAERKTGQAARDGNAVGCAGLGCCAEDAFKGMCRTELALA